jgi:RNA polymerase sigma-54 factor
MRLSQELALKQEMHITQQLILQMQLLQVSALDLEQLVRKELEENPALEQSDDQPDPAGADVSPVLPDPTAAADSGGPAGGAQPGADGNGIIDVRPGEEYALSELLPDDTYAPPMRFVGSDDSDVSAVELAAGPSETLNDALMPKLRAMLGAEDARVAEFIVESLDEDGFLTMTIEELAENQGVDVERVKAILYAVQRLEPGGIGCRDRRESFLVQLEMAGHDPMSLERKLLSDHWDLLMKKQTGKVARLCGVAEADIRAAIGTILRLEPRPARRFTGSAPAYVAPDFSVEWQDNRIVAVPNDETFPRLRLSQKYIDILRDTKAYNRDQVEFARKKFQRALMFLKGIESRRRTLQRLVELVIEQQREFFLNGRQFLKPDTLRRAADLLNVHPSTVSRAIAGKYVETNHGIFPLSYFFKAGAGDKSRTSIKQRIRAIIDAEDKSKPLSDDEICTMLKSENTEISRRTVAKYRAELAVPGCNDRKCF